MVWRSPQAPKPNPLDLRFHRLKMPPRHLADDIKDVYAEAKSSGFDPALMRQIIKLRAMDPHDRQEQEEGMDAQFDAHPATQRN